MNAVLAQFPWISAMLALLGCSAFFSASEAALFSLRQQDRQRMQNGNRPARIAAALLADPDRLLSAVLFGNLVVNMVYFALASLVGLRLERTGEHGEAVAFAFAAGSLLILILLGEMIPKTLGALGSRQLAGWLAVPLAMAVRAVDPVMPLLRLATLLSRRLLWPRFQPEAYLRLADLERAIEISTGDEHLVEQEQMVLSNIVAMSDIRVDEWMRPRTQYLCFRPPVSLADLEGRMTPSGYLLLTDGETDEVASAIDLAGLTSVPAQQLERYARPVAYLPWCASVAEAFEQIGRNHDTVVAVVNEFGETIGILTFEDLLDTMFTSQPSRSSRLLNRTAVEPLGPDTWQVTGVTGLRHLAHTLQVELPESRMTTIAGVIQETLQRLPAAGDEGDWGPFHFRVVENLGRAQLLVELQRIARRPEETDG